MYKLTLLKYIMYIKQFKKNKWLYKKRFNKINDDIKDLYDTVTTFQDDDGIRCHNDKINKK